MLQNIEITTTPTDTNEQAGGCCGGACCSTDAAAPTATEAGISQAFTVEGMTCGHCVSSVTEEISGLAGVEGIDVQLVAGGQSTVTVASDSPLRIDDVRAAVSEAGYRLVEV